MRDARRMRTTLDIDDDLLASIRDFAEYERISLGRAVSDILRKSMEQPVEEWEIKNGVPLMPHSPGEPPLTPEMVQQMLDEDDY
jgi:hypothetical protein